MLRVSDRLPSLIQLYLETVNTRLLTAKGHLDVIDLASEGLELRSGLFFVFDLHGFKRSHLIFHFIEDVFVSAIAEEYSVHKFLRFGLDVGQLGLFSLDVFVHVLSSDSDGIEKLTTDLLYAGLYIEPVELVDLVNFFNARFQRDLLTRGQRNLVIFTFLVCCSSYVSLTN